MYLIGLYEHAVFLWSGIIYIIEELQMVGFICLQATGEVFLSTDYLARPLDQTFHCFSEIPRT